MPDAPQSFTQRYFPALAERNFRVFWLGQCVSMSGTWMQSVAQSWLVLELTGSAAKLSLVNAMQFFPVMLFSLLAGPFIDRFPKKKTLLVTQVALAILALLLAVLTATHLVRYWMVVVLALGLGMVSLIDNPTRQAWVIELSGRKALMNAVSLNSVAFNLARILGPAIAGLLIGSLGIAPCFFLNALSFVAVIAAILTIDAGEKVTVGPIEGVGDVFASVKEGLSYIRRRSEIAVPLALLAVISTIVINYTIFVPTFAKMSLGRSAQGFAFLMTAMGIGSLAGALLLAVASHRGPSRLRLYGGAAGMCVAMLALGLQRNYALSAVLLGFVGFFTITFTASTNATVQLASDEGYRGRVMSVFSLVFGGVTPIGALYAGAVSEATSPAFCISLSGSIGLAATLPLVFVLWRKSTGGRAGGAGGAAAAQAAQAAAGEAGVGEAAHTAAQGAAQAAATSRPPARATPLAEDAPTEGGR